MAQTCSNPGEYITTMNQRLVQELSEVRSHMEEMKTEKNELSEELGSREQQVTYQRGLLKSLVEIRRYNSQVLSFASELENIRRSQVRIVLRKSVRELEWGIAAGKVSSISVIFCLLSFAMSSWLSLFVGIIGIIIPLITVAKWVTDLGTKSHTRVEELDKCAGIKCKEIDTLLEARCEFETNVDFMDQLIDLS